MDPDGEQILFQILFLVFLTLVNAFFAGAEMAVVSVNKNKIRMLAEEGNKNAKLIQRLSDDSTKFLSTIQVAITFAGFFSSASAATGISQVLGGYLAQFHIPFSNTISVVVVTIILSYFTLVFGELVPKRIALQKAEAFSLFTVRPIYMISKIMSPFIALLSGSTNLCLKILGMKNDRLEEAVSEEEIKALLEVGSENGVFNEIEKDMIHSIFSFDDKIVRSVMVPRKDVVAIEVNQSLADCIDELLETPYSRIPVYEETIDQIVGMIKMKDIMKISRKKPIEQVKIQDILHSVYFIPETKNVDELFIEMKKEKKRMAIVIDEYGGFSGIVTIEDLVEEVVGEIEDELEVSVPLISKLDTYTYRVNGAIKIEELNYELHTKLSSDNYDTLSGLFIEELGYIPKEGDNPEVTIGNIKLYGEKVYEHVIEQIILTIEQKNREENEQ